MLELGDSRGFTLGVVGNPIGIKIETPYAEYTVSHKVSVSGKSEVWAHLKTRDAFEVCLVGGTYAEPTLVLMRKRRTVGDQPVLKLPGGYLRGPAETYMTEKVNEDTGIVLASHAFLPLGQVLGHGEIETPIKLFWATDWRTGSGPREGVEIMKVSLDEALRLAMQNEIENDSSFTGIVRLHYLWKNGQVFSQ